MAHFGYYRYLTLSPSFLYLPESSAFDATLHALTPRTLVEPGRSLRAAATIATDCFP